MTSLSSDPATSIDVNALVSTFVFRPPGGTSDMESPTNVVEPVVTLARGTRKIRVVVNR